MTTIEWIIVIVTFSIAIWMAIISDRSFKNVKQRLIFMPQSRSVKQVIDV